MDVLIWSQRGESPDVRGARLLSVSEDEEEEMDHDSPPLHHYHFLIKQPTDLSNEAVSG